MRSSHASSQCACCTCFASCSTFGDRHSAQRNPIFLPMHMLLSNTHNTTCVEFPDFGDDIGSLYAVMYRTIPPCCATGQSTTILHTDKKDPHGQYLQSIHCLFIDSTEQRQTRKQQYLQLQVYDAKGDNLTPIHFGTIQWIVFHLILSL